MNAWVAQLRFPPSLRDQPAQRACRAAVPLAAVEPEAADGPVEEIAVEAEDAGIADAQTAEAADEQAADEQADKKDPAPAEEKDQSDES